MGYIEIIFLILFYLFLILLCRRVSNRIILTPEFVFIGCFIPQFVLALFYVKKWDLALCLDTVLVYVLGGFLFVAFSLLFRGLMRNYYEGIDNKADAPVLVIKKWKLVFTALFQIVAVFLMIRALKSVTGQTSISEAIAYYNIASKEAGLVMSGLAAKMNLFAYMSGFIWMYYIICGMVQKNKTNMILLLINLALSVVNNMLTGSRGGVLQNVLFGVFLYYFLWSKTYGWKSISLRVMLTFIALAIVMIMGFQLSLQWVGRTTSVEKMSDYLAMYFSAEMKNLDINIRSGMMSFRKIGHFVTLRNLIVLIEKIPGINISNGYKSVSAYHTINGYELGNVSTVFNSFIGDMHYAGLIVYEAITALVGQVFLVESIKQRDNHFTLDLRMVIYIYILCKLAFSFFSGWFFNDIFSGGFLWTIIIWFALRFFLENDIIRVKVL